MYPGSKLLQVNLSVVNFVGYMLIAHDRPGHKLCEEAYKEQVVGEEFLRFHFPPVNVDHIGNSLKGVKRNSDGQSEGWDLELRSQQRIDVFIEECAVLKHHQDSDVDEDRQP